MTRTKVEISEKWKEANIEIMRLGVIQSINGITGYDEDLVDLWESRIPTNLKLMRNIINRKGEEVNFIEEWDKLVASIKIDDLQPIVRQRVIAKGRLISDLLQVYGVYMKILYAKKPGEGGPFAKEEWKDDIDGASP